MFETFQYLIKNMTMEEVTEPVDLEYATVILQAEMLSTPLYIQSGSHWKTFCVILRM